MLSPMFRRAFVGLSGAAMLAVVAHAADTTPADDAPDLTKVRASIAAKNYAAALADLRTLAASYAQPDVYSLMGFALRKTGDRSQAMTYYEKALQIDPAHKGALEYQGELYVELGQLDKAKENLVKLARLCASECEEREDLEAAIAQAEKPKG